MNFNPNTIRHYVRATGRNIHNLRQKKRFTLNKLSRLSGLPISLLDQCELGKNRMPVVDLMKIAAVLKIDARELLSSTKD